MKKSEVLNLYKHNIVYRNIKNSHKKQFVISMVMCIVSVFGFCYLFFVNSGINNSVNVFNPISELYRDVETASFVSSGNVTFVVPIKTEKYNINSDSIDFEVGASIMVYAPADGVIKEIVDFGNGNKNIIIKHSDNMFSKISNVNIVGVKVGEIVKQGKTLATAKQGDVINFSIELDNKNVEGLYLNKSFVKWE